MMTTTRMMREQCARTSNSRPTQTTLVQRQRPTLMIAREMKAQRIAERHNEPIVIVMNVIHMLMRISEH